MDRRQYRQAAGLKFAILGRCLADRCPLRCTVGFVRVSRSQFSEYSTRIIRFSPQFFESAPFARIIFLNYLVQSELLIPNYDFPQAEMFQPAFGNRAAL